MKNSSIILIFILAKAFILLHDFLPHQHCNLHFHKITFQKNDILVSHVESSYHINFNFLNYQNHNKKHNHSNNGESDDECLLSVSYLNFCSRKQQGYFLSNTNFFAQTYGLISNIDFVTFQLIKNVLDNSRKCFILICKKLIYCSLGDRSPPVCNYFQF